MNTVQPATARFLDGITQQDVLLVVCACTVFAVFMGLNSFRRQRDPVLAISLATHVQVWQISSGINLLFWYLLGSGMDVVSAILLPAAFLCADLAKVIIPRSCDYASSTRKQWGVQFLRGLSVFASIGLGSLYAQHNALASLETKLVWQGAQATVQAADTRVQARLPDADNLTEQARLRAGIEAIKQRDAVNLAGQAVFLSGKKSSVWEATHGCQPDNAFSQVTANDCKAFGQLRTRLDTLESELSVQTANLDNQVQAYTTARASLQTVQPSLPVTEMLAAGLKGVGVSPAVYGDPQILALLFGLILAIALELLVIVTLEKPVKIASVIARNGRNEVKYNAGTLPDNAGQVPGQARELDILRSVTLTTLDSLVDWSVVKDADKFRVCDGHRRVLVSLMQHYGKKVSTGYFFQFIRQQYGDGVRKAYIEECKLILHRNGYMTARAWGETGTQYQWCNPHEVCAVVRQRRSKVGTPLKFEGEALVRD